jgi:hypothetical protein
MFKFLITIAAKDGNNEDCVQFETLRRLVAFMPVLCKTDEDMEEVLVGINSMLSGTLVTHVETSMYFINLTEMEN